jgi:hypothetical protein
MTWKLSAYITLSAAVLSSAMAWTQSKSTIEVRLRLAFTQGTIQHVPPAVLWLKPTDRTPPLPFAPQVPYTLLQRGKMFKPHLIVVPVGSAVLFPNADPFFHNVFSLFDGKRFDLGLYEAGSTKEVRFSREGVSYIFCNIHPEMSAVVLAISTPIYAIADSDGMFRLPDVPPGDYELRIWVEGVQQPALGQLTRHIHLVPGAGDLGELAIPAIAKHPEDHLNKFGRQYDKDPKPSY